MAKAAKNHPLYHWRTARKCTLQSLADDLNCTQSFLSQIELREKQPSLSMAARLSSLTGLPLEAFVIQSEAVQ